MAHIIKGKRTVHLVGAVVPLFDLASKRRVAAKLGGGYFFMYPRIPKTGKNTAVRRAFCYSDQIFGSVARYFASSSSVGM